MQTTWFRFAWLLPLALRLGLPPEAAAQVKTPPRTAKAGPAKAAPAPAAPEPPRYLEAARITASGGQTYATPALAALTPAEERALTAALAGLPAFPSYSYSGCHDRAHALYLLLEQWRPRLAKVWLYAPSFLAPALGGTIRYQPAAGEPTSWEYHVAVVYRQAASNQLMVLDPAIAPTVTPVALPAWFGKFDIPAASVWTLLDGKYYSFFRTENCQYAARQVFNGGLFEYAGDSRQQHWIPNNIARDAVAAAWQQRKDCGTIDNLFLRPIDLLNALNAAETTPFPAATCQPYSRLYREEAAKWRRLLKE